MLVGIMLVGIMPVGIAPVGIGTCTRVKLRLILLCLFQVRRVRQETQVLRVQLAYRDNQDNVEVLASKVHLAV